MNPKTRLSHLEAFLHARLERECRYAKAIEEAIGTGIRTIEYTGRNELTVVGSIDLWGYDAGFTLELADIPSIPRRWKSTHTSDSWP
ncbi:hypothetical protein A0H81_07593 [Grifola frondosa]|uniref:Uncharacterized protein n=1 Tax=Grifola frondosa TaxID=5627 RepID=A0A1C7MAQ4_GRIFR|nr:hypothetical protein A0H81_07593 [Grifola frondosa]